MPRRCPLNSRCPLFRASVKGGSTVIVVCKKYYLEVVLGEVNDSTTYEHVTEDYSKLVSGHLKFMAANRIVVQLDNRCLPQFY